MNNNNSKVIKPRDGISDFKKPARGLGVGAGLAAGLTILYGVQTLAQTSPQKEIENPVVVYENHSSPQTDKVVESPIDDSNTSSKSLTQRMAESTDTFSLYTIGQPQAFATCEVSSIDFSTKGSMGERLEKCLEGKIGDVSGEVVVRHIGVPFDLTLGDIQYNHSEFSDLIEGQYRNTRDQNEKVWIIPNQINGNKVVVEDYNNFEELPQTTIVTDNYLELPKGSVITNDLPKVEPRFISGKYRADINADGFVDAFSPTGEGTTRYVDGKTGSLESIPTSNLRAYFLEDVFDYGGEHQAIGEKPEALSSYVAARGEGGQDILDYFVETNEPEIAKQTRLENSFTFGRLVDKVANAHVRGNLLEDSFEKDYDSGNVSFVLSQENALDARAYTSTFAQEVTPLDLVLRHGAGSSIYETFKRDFLPHYQENAALVQNRGAGLNQLILEINEGGKEQLPRSIANAYASQVSMYNAQVEASKQRVEDLNKL